MREEGCSRVVFYWRICASDGHFLSIQEGAQRSDSAVRCGDGRASDSGDGGVEVFFRLEFYAAVWEYDGCAAFAFILGSVGLYVQEAVLCVRGCFCVELAVSVRANVVLLDGDREYWARFVLGSDFVERVVEAFV